MFVDRENGQIVRKFRNEQYEGQEWVPDDSPELEMRPKEDRIAELQTAYDSDLEKLNKAWLAALIADGVGEASRQASIKEQMQALSEQLDNDILTIIMEE